MSKNIATKFINKKFSQNYFVNDDKLDFLIGKYKSSFQGHNIVDIGAGEGIFVRHFAFMANEITAIDIDQKNIDKLNKLNIKNLKILKGDVRDVNLDDIYNEYVIFSNIPFFLTSEILKEKVLLSKKLREAFIFMQKEAVNRYMESFKNPSNSYLSILFNTYFDIEIIYQFDKKDFFPSPSVDVVLVRFKKKDIILDEKYFDFISFMFNVRKATIKNVLLELFTYKQIRNHIQKNVGIRLDSKCSAVSSVQWLKIFNSYTFLNCPKFESTVKGSFLKISRYQKKQNNKVIV